MNDGWRNVQQKLKDALTCSYESGIVVQTGVV